MLPNPEGIIARASNVSLDVARLPRLSMLLAVATANYAPRRSMYLHSQRGAGWP